MFSDKLKELLKKNKIKKYDFAKKIGVSRQVVSYWINGKTKPSAINLLKIALFFNISIFELVDPKILNEDKSILKSLKTKNIKKEV